MITAPDPTKMIKFCEEVLEFRATEYIVNNEGQPIAALAYRKTKHILRLPLASQRVNGIN